MPQAFAIRNKATKAPWTAKSGKAVWKKAAHAKAAWHATCEYAWKPPADVTSAYFNEQTNYEIYTIGEDEKLRLTHAEELLAAAFDYLQDLNAEDSSVAGEILAYFEKYGMEENV